MAGAVPLAGGPHPVGLIAMAKGRFRAPRRGQRPRAKNAAPKRAPNPPVASEPAAPEPVGPFRLGAVPGATPGKWIRAWRERMPRTALELMPLTVATQRADIATVDAALVRLPIDGNGLHVIRLYDDLPVVVMPVGDDLTAAAELSAADLAGRVLIAPADDVLRFTASGAVAPTFMPPATTADAVELVAARVGIAVMPMSLARLHHRRDVTYRPVHGGPVSTVALAWIAERTTPLVDTFVGIVRGRTANSSR